MAIEYLSTWPNPNPSGFRSGKKVNSGVADAERPFGFRGLNAGANFIWGRQTPVLIKFGTAAVGSSIAGGGFVQRTSTTSTSFVAGESTMIYIPVGVVQLRCIVDCQHYSIRWQGADITTTTGSHDDIRGNSPLEFTIPVTGAGNIDWIRWDFSRTAGGATGFLSGFLLFCDQLASGDFT